MGSGIERAQASSHSFLRPRLAISAALAVLIVAAPSGDRTSALAMNLGSGFGGARFGAAGAMHLNHVPLNNGPRVAPRGNLGGTTIVGSHNIGIVGHGEHGHDVPSDPCKLGRTRSERCVVNTGHD